MIGAIFVLGGAFVLVIFGFWSIAYQINKKETKKMGLE
jgi:ABC-type transporter Mla subunit MlaD